MVATSQPLATQAGLQMLQQGGNAVDAAVAAAAVLNVTEPTSCGIGGDMFALLYLNDSQQVVGINGSGRAPAQLTLEQVRNDGLKGPALPSLHPHTATVPGAIAGMLDLLDRHGSLERSEVFRPAIELAEDGFPVAPLTAYFWGRGVRQLQSGPYGTEMLLDGQAPKAGQLMRNPTLGRTFRTIVEEGRAGFYDGRVANAIVDLLGSMGGFLSLDDLRNHRSEWVEPISVDYKGTTVWEIPPNGQGLTALLGLNLLEGTDFSQVRHLSTEYFHLLIEALRIAFADTRYYVADPAVVDVPVEELLSKSYASKRRSLLLPDRHNPELTHGTPTANSDTVYFCTADAEGNACSFIYSNYMGFGTGLIPEGCGFTLQNRGANFSLDPSHPNVLAPNKRPYHTIIPGMATVTDTQDLYCAFGVMGGFMQPQGHVQVMLDMLEYDLGPQETLDLPRFCLTDGTAGGEVALEDGIPLQVMAELARMGHKVVPTVGHARAIFGRGQIIRKHPESGTWWAGSDPRADGLALGF